MLCAPFWYPFPLWILGEVGWIGAACLSRDVFTSGWAASFNQTLKGCFEIHPCSIPSWHGPQVSYPLSPWDVTLILPSSPETPSTVSPGAMPQGAQSHREAGRTVQTRLEQETSLKLLLLPLPSCQRQVCGQLPRMHTLPQEGSGSSAAPAVAFIPPCPPSLRVRPPCHEEEMPYFLVGCMALAFRFQKWAIGH